MDIPHVKGLLGHSDADVLAHAVSDALLGAIRGGDIGKLFPDTDPAYAGADSLKLLAAVAAKVREEGYRILDVDSVVAAQAPQALPLSRPDAGEPGPSHGHRGGERGPVKATTTERSGVRRARGGHLGHRRRHIVPPF